MLIASSVIALGAAARMADQSIEPAKASDLPSGKLKADKNVTEKSAKVPPKPPPPKIEKAPIKPETRAAKATKVSEFSDKSKANNKNGTEKTVKIPAKPPPPGPKKNSPKLEKDAVDGGETPEKDAKTSKKNPPNPFPSQSPIKKSPVPIPPRKFEAPPPKPSDPPPPKINDKPALCDSNKTTKPAKPPIPERQSQIELLPKPPKPPPPKVTKESVQTPNDFKEKNKSTRTNTVELTKVSSKLLKEPTASVEASKDAPAQRDDTAKLEGEARTSRTNSQGSVASSTKEDPLQGVSRWKRMVLKSSSAIKTSKESVSQSVTNTKEATTAKLTATKEATTAKITATKEATTAKITATKEATTAKLAATKEATTAKISATGESVKCTSSAASEAVKTSSSNAAASVSSSFWNVVQMAKTAAEETKKKMPGRAAETITLIHYNDVYNVESRDVEPVGGAARFVSAIQSYNELEPLVLFSGDIFAPSIMSTFTKGEQMVPVLNASGTHCAVFGNHDFDFGLDVLISLVEKTEFPWLMSNVIDNEAAQPLGNGKISQIIEWKGRKLGLIGLVEREWLETLATINPDEVTYTDYVDAGSMLASELKHKGCEYVIALTHMRTPNDIRLAENVPEIDLILGGHDHVYEKRKVNGTYILKSGTDFRQFSVLNLDFRESPVEVNIEAINITKEFEPDEELNNILEKYSDVVEGKMGEVLGEISCDLDGRFTSVRTAETNLGNLVTDVMVAALACDCALVNSGTLRSDTIHPKGQFLLRDLLSILPMMDALVVLDVTGEQIHGALENGVSQWPKLEGRFPQVSGIRFAFDPSQPPGHRVDPHFVKIGDEYLELNNHYKLITKSYLANGKDGYDCLASAPVLVDDECAPTLTSAVQNHFKAISMVKNTKDRKTSVHHQSLVTLSRKTSIVRQLTEDGHLPASHLSIPSTPRSHSPVSEVGRAKSPQRGRLCKQPSVEDLEKVSCQLTPGVEGRILQLTLEVAKQLKQEKDLDISRLVIAEVDEKSCPSSPEDDLRRELFGTTIKSSTKNTGEKTKSKNGKVKEDLDLK